MQFRSFLIVLIVMLVSRLSFAQDKYEWSEKGCKYDIKFYSAYWIKDSLCVNGFRTMVGITAFFKKCTLIGEKWKDWEEYFGKATRKIKESNYTKYRYRMSEGEYVTPGLIFLDIHVSEEGFIIYFQQWEVDG